MPQVSSGEKKRPPRMHTIDPYSQIGEHETKYVFPNSRARILRNWLAATCDPDPEYSSGIISSIYFDSRGLQYLGEKLSSDYLKTKVRLRWYSSSEDRKPFPALFLEVKQKVGSARKKMRTRLKVESDWVLKRRLDHPDYLRLNTLMGDHGIVIDQALLPVFEISYHRTRYIEPYTGARISVDSDIHVSRSNAFMVSGNNSQYISSAVFEFKDKSGKLPDRLSPMIALSGAKRSSFSKYSSCYAQVQGITY